MKYVIIYLKKVTLLFVGFHLLIFLFIGVFMWDFNRLFTMWDCPGTFVWYRILIVLPVLSCALLKIKT
jgi:hypothetical protein